MEFIIVMRESNYIKFLMEIGIIVLLFKGDIMKYYVDFFICFVNLLFCYKEGLLN